MRADDEHREPEAAGLAPRLRVVMGAVGGFIIYAVHLAGTLLSIAFHPTIVAHARTRDYVALVAYSLVFVGAGAVAGRLTVLRPRVLRFVAIGALVGSVAWSYLTITWPLTYSFSTLGPSNTTWGAAWIIGAAAGMLGGLLLFGITALRR